MVDGEGRGRYGGHRGECIGVRVGGEELGRGRGDREKRDSWSGRCLHSPRISAGVVRLYLPREDARDYVTGRGMGVVVGGDGRGSGRDVDDSKGSVVAPRAPSTPSF